MMNDSLVLIQFNETTPCIPEIHSFQEKPHQIHHIFALILGPVNAILNGICVHIFNHSSWKKSAMSRILKGLSVIELCMGLSLFAHAMITRIALDASQLPAIITDHYVWKTTVKSILNFIFTIFLNLSLLAFQIARNWAVVLLAAYRYDRICRPIGTPTAFPNERITSILVIVSILSCMIVLPRAFEVGIILCQSNGHFQSSAPVIIQNRIYQIAYLGIVMFAVQSGGPVICVCVLSAFVIRLIAKRRKIHRMNEQKSARFILQDQLQTTGEQNNSSGRRTADQRLSLMSGRRASTICPLERPAPSGDKLIFAMCITFFILETPAFFSKILNPYLEANYIVIDTWLSVMANILIYLDSTLNAFVYMASNPQFRKIASEQIMSYRERIFQHSNHGRNTDESAVTNQTIQ